MILVSFGLSRNPTPGAIGMVIYEKFLGAELAPRAA